MARRTRARARPASAAGGRPATRLPQSRAVDPRRSSPTGWLRRLDRQRRRAGDGGSRGERRVARPAHWRTIRIGAAAASGEPGRSLREHCDRIAVPGTTFENGPRFNHAVVELLSKAAVDNPRLPWVGRRPSCMVHVDSGPIEISPNCSLSVRGAWLFFASLAVASFSMATWSRCRDWPVLPFAGLELALVGWALNHSAATPSSPDDRGHRVLSRSMNTLQRQGRIVFPRHWAQVQIRAGHSPLHPTGSPSSRTVAAARSGVSERAGGQVSPNG